MNVIISRDSTAGSIYPLLKVPTYYQNFGDFFTKPWNHHYSPLNFLFNGWLFKQFSQPFAFYLINLCLFYIDCVLLYILVYTISKDLIVALLTRYYFLHSSYDRGSPSTKNISLNIILIQSIFLWSQG